MKATGIVRRIDDLGRVVIPKEIRRTMRIREGDPLEIYTDKELSLIHIFGVTWQNLENDKKAFANYTKAIKLNPNYALAYKNRGKLYATRKDYPNALADYRRALELYETDGASSMVGILQKWIAEVEATIREAEARLHQIDRLMTDPSMAEIERKMQENRESFNTFIEEQPPRRVPVPQFHMLRRWNSYTPIIAKNPFVSKGGGYYLVTGAHGIVIDPGFNFIDNFQRAGFRFSDIDTILLTHAHNDHPTDLESILTLLHKYNDAVRGSEEEDDKRSILGAIREEEPTITSDELRRRTDEQFAKSPRRKRLNIYMTASTFKKYANFLSLDSACDYTVILMRAEETLSIDPEIGIQVLEAKHNDILSDQDSVGFLFLYQKTALLYTGDTGFDTRIEAAYTALKQKLPQETRIVLLAHIGGFKPYEQNYKMEDFDGGKAFYKNHLGRLGLARLVEILQPELCVISEFGEEFTDCRIKLSELFQQCYPQTQFLPADIGLCMDMQVQTLAVTSLPQKSSPVTGVCCDFVPAGEVRILSKEEDASLKYYRKDIDPSILAQRPFDINYRSVPLPDGP